MESDRYLRITLRIPRELHARIEAEADRTSKSQNAEIVARLEASFEDQDDSQVQEWEANSSKLESQWNFLVMRGEVAKARLDGLLVRAMLLKNERDQLAHGLKKDKDPLRLTTLNKELQQIQEEMKILTEEITSLTNERKSMEIKSQASLSAGASLRDEIQNRLSQEPKKQSGQSSDKAFEALENN